MGNDGASLSFVKIKVITCRELGFDSTQIKLPNSITQEELLRQIENLNHNQDVDGYIIQLPLPHHIDEKEVLLKVDPAKDVDGFHPESIGKMALGMDTFLSATPAGIMELLKRKNIYTVGKKCVVLGMSNICLLYYS